MKRETPTLRFDRDIDLYITTDELFAWCWEWAEKFNLYCLLARQLPEFQFSKNIKPGKLSLATLSESDWDRVYLSSTLLNRRGKDINELNWGNRDSLKICFPKRSRKGFWPGSFSTQSCNRARRQVYKQIIADLFIKATFGMWVVNSKGASVFVEYMCFSPAVQSLYRGGTVLRAPSGGCTVRIDAPLK
jgi:hypothetical protein